MTYGTANVRGRVVQLGVPKLYARSHTTRRGQCMLLPLSHGRLLVLALRDEPGAITSTRTFRNRQWRAAKRYYARWVAYLDSQDRYPPNWTRGDIDAMERWRAATHP